VQITVAESIGVEDRGRFYETAGAMRDIVQNHVLQVLSLFLMEPPTSFHPEAIRDEKQLLRAIRPFAGEQDIAQRAVRTVRAAAPTRTQCRAIARNRARPGLVVETFVALRLDIDNWRWAGVPVYVRTGKRLPQRITEVAIEFQRPPHPAAVPRRGPGARRASAARRAKRGTQHPIRRQGARPVL
jgi:glucose-6-phosphate 1-dehydrogenase